MDHAILLRKTIEFDHGDARRIQHLLKVYAFSAQLGREENLAPETQAILEAAARLVCPGGRVVYATCSLLTAENEAVVDAFLAGHPDFRPAPAAEVLARHGIAVDGDFLRLLPHRQNTDGFFAAVLDKKT